MNKFVCWQAFFYPALCPLFRISSPSRSQAFQHYAKLASAALAVLLLFTTPAMPATEQTVTFRVPPVKIPLNVKDQRIDLEASALITLASKAHGLNILTLRLTADLSGLQQHLTELLSAELDKNDHCGDRIAIQRATLTPASPASLAVVELHYERWACVKVFGKQQSKRVIGGNAVMPMTLTPAVEDNGTELRLVPDVGPVQADGSLGELLRSGALGQALQDKIRKSVLNALQKGTDLSTTLPPAVQGYAKIKNAQFKDGGSGQLLAVLLGEIQITDEQIQALAKQVKERVAGK